MEALSLLEGSRFRAHLEANLLSVDGLLLEADPAVVPALLQTIEHSRSLHNVDGIPEGCTILHHELVAVE